MTRNQRLLWSIGTVFVVGYALVPFLWIASLSLKTEGTLTDGNFFPRDITLENYTGIFEGDQFPAALRNSIGIALIATLIAITLATTTAYAIARLDFPGKTLVLGPPWPSPCSRPSRWSGRCSTCGGGSGCSTPGRG